MQNDYIGASGESLFAYRMGRPINGEFLFKVEFLGDKWPDVDFLVELVGVDSCRPIFFVQVKATTRVGKSASSRLRVKAGQKNVERMSLYPAPTYVAGVDLKREEVYLISANGECTAPLSSITTEYPLDSHNFAVLYDEVKAFWMSPLSPKLSSRFLDSDWK